MANKLAFAFLAAVLLGAASVPDPAFGNCLCIFDLDRTLTGAQDNTTACPNNEVFPGIYDPAYSAPEPSDLTLSELGQDGGGSGYCGGCNLGVVSAGYAGGSDSDERAQLLIQLNASQRLGGGFMDHCLSPVTSPLVMGCPDERKQETVADVVAWYGDQGVAIAPGDVWFFDDRDENVAPFEGTGFNARQASCGLRDGDRGLCGATLAEVANLAPGIVLCGDDDDDHSYGYMNS